GGPTAHRGGPRGRRCPGGRRRGGQRHRRSRRRGGGGRHGRRGRRERGGAVVTRYDESPLDTGAPAEDAPLEAALDAVGVNTPAADPVVAAATEEAAVAAASGAAAGQPAPPGGWWARWKQRTTQGAPLYPLGV